MAPLRRHLVFTGDVVFQVAAMKASDRADFVRVIEAIAVTPRSAELGVRPVKDPDLPEAYTVPFDKALLLYQVRQDHPALHLLQVTPTG